jgi:hypothetical protein
MAAVKLPLLLDEILKAKFLNLIAKGNVARDTQATLNAAKATIRSCLPCGRGVYQTGSVSATALVGGNLHRR